MLTADELREIEASPYKADFPLLTTRSDLAFLDSAATAQRPASVLDAERRFYETMNANPLRGLYGLSVEATAAIGAARARIARFIGAKDGNEIIFTRNTTEALNLVAHSLGSMALSPGDEVLVSIMEHHSNIIPWQQICAHTGATLRYLYLEDYAIPEAELAAKINSHTKIVSVAHVSNVLGTQNDIAAIAKAAHVAGAYLVVDAAQSAPHVHVDVAELGCDLLAFSSHKLGGPMGIGVLWGKAELLRAMPPFLTGGEMIDSVTEQGAVWAPVPAKFEAGTQDAAGAYATEAAIAYLEEKGFATLERRERLLVRYLCERLQALDYVRVIGAAEPERHVGAVSFNVGDVHPHDVASILDMQGVCIRAGHHCAEPLLAYLGEQSTCRASVAFYNDKADIDQLVAGLETVWSVFHG